MMALCLVQATQRIQLSALHDPGLVRSVRCTRCSVHALIVTASACASGSDGARGRVNGR